MSILARFWWVEIEHGRRVHDWIDIDIISLLFPFDRLLDSCVQRERPELRSFQKDAAAMPTQRANIRPARIVKMADTLRSPKGCIPSTLGIPAPHGNHNDQTRDDESPGHDGHEKDAASTRRKLALGEPVLSMRWVESASPFQLHPR